MARFTARAALIVLGTFILACLGTPALAQQGQASLTLSNCASELCNANNTAWTLGKTGPGPVTGDNTITWAVTATRGATTDNMLSVNGVITVTNTGSAPATIGNIVVNLQKPAAKNAQKTPWVSVAADIATATNGDAATSANIVASGSAENPTVNAVQGAGNYTVSGAQGTFIQTSGSGTLEFTDASNNTLFSLTPQVTLPAGQSITLLYTATFNNTVLGLAEGSLVRAEALVSFGNAGARGGSGSTASNIDVNGDGSINSDEAKVRTVPCRVTKAVPALQKGNDVVALSDTSVSVTGSNVAVSKFVTDIGRGTGSQDINATGTFSVSVDAVCTPPATETVTNTAYLDGASSSVTVQGPQTGVDPDTLAPIYQTYEFACVTGVNKETSNGVGVSCEVPPSTTPPSTTPNVCTFSQGGYAGGGARGDILDNNFAFLRIGIEDGTGSLHDAQWKTLGTITNGKNATCTGLKCYLRSQHGTPGALTADTDDATSTGGGTLAVQVATLGLTVGFNVGLIEPSLGFISGNTAVGAGEFTALHLCNLAEGTGVSPDPTLASFTLTAAQAAALNGRTIPQVLADANNAIGGNGLPSYVGSFSDLNQLVAALNLSFDNLYCTPSAFASAYLCK